MIPVGEGELIAWVEIGEIELVLIPGQRGAVPALEKRIGIRKIRPVVCPGVSPVTAFIEIKAVVVFSFDNAIDAIANGKKARVHIRKSPTRVQPRQYSQRGVDRLWIAGRAREPIGCIPIGDWGQITKASSQRQDRAGSPVEEAGGAASTAILAATAGKFAQIQSDGTSWQTMMAN